jgi:ribonuclease inhibitor
MKKEFVVDLKDAKDSAALHDALQRSLPLPDCYGRNLDAFYDVLTEFGADWRIVFLNANAKRAGKTFKALCRDAMAATPGLEIAFKRQGADKSI